MDASQGYVRAGLDDERIWAVHCGCIWSWRRTPGVARVTKLHECGSYSGWTGAVHYSIIQATYQNEMLEQAIRWQ